MNEYILIALIVIVYFVGIAVGYYIGNENRKNVLEKHRITEYYKAEVEKYRWDHPMNGGNKDDEF